MGIGIKVIGSTGDPKDYYSVTVVWYDGSTSSGQTGSDGIYHTGINTGTIMKVSVVGRELFSSSNGEPMSGGILELTY